MSTFNLVDGESGGIPDGGGGGGLSGGLGAGLAGLASGLMGGGQRGRSETDRRNDLRENALNYLMQGGGLKNAEALGQNAFGRHQANRLFNESNLSPETAALLREVQQGRENAAGNVLGVNAGVDQYLHRETGDDKFGPQQKGGLLNGIIGNAFSDNPRGQEILNAMRERGAAPGDDEFRRGADFETNRNLLSRIARGALGAAITIGSGGSLAAPGAALMGGAIRG